MSRSRQMASFLRLTTCATFATTSALVLVRASPALGATLSVGPGQAYARPCAAISAAQAGDTIEVDAAGSYAGDTCAWSTDNLTVRGVHGRAKIDATGAALTQQKGIFVIAANNATIESFELSGAAITAAAGNNGAGIRHQGLNLVVRDCYLHDNQDGILGAPPTDGTGTVLIESTELANNGAGDGFSHNMYLNHYATFTLHGSWSHDARVGHLVKTRAAVNYILYNRITGQTGTDSYEIDVPNGGRTYIVGNLIEQGASSQNPTIINYEEEGTYATNPVLDLFVVNNSFVNDLGSGTFVSVGADVKSPILLQNDLFTGGGTITTQASASQIANFTGAPLFVDAAAFDYHLGAGSPCIDKGQTPTSGDGFSLLPVEEYLHPASTEGRTIVGAIDIGAYELGGGVPLVDGGGSLAADGGGESGPADAGDAGVGTEGGAGSGPGNGDGGGAAGDAGASGAGSPKGGCGCGVVSESPSTPWVLVLAIGSAALRRRRPVKPAA